MASQEITLDGNQKSGDHLLRLVVYPIIYRGFSTISRWFSSPDFWLASTVPDFPQSWLLIHSFFSSVRNRFSQVEGSVLLFWCHEKTRGVKSDTFKDEFFSCLVCFLLGIKNRFSEESLDHHFSRDGSWWEDVKTKVLGRVPGNCYYDLEDHPRTNVSGSDHFYFSAMKRQFFGGITPCRDLLTMVVNHLLTGNKSHLKADGWKMMNFPFGARTPSWQVCLLLVSGRVQSRNIYY